MIYLIILFDELMSSLQAHEERLLRSNEKNEEKAFQVKGESQKEKMESSAGRGRGRGGFPGRGHGRGQGRGEARGRFSENKQNKSLIQCHYCKKFGHKQAYCWNKQKDENNQTSFAEKTDEESKLFMALFCDGEVSNDVWFLDIGCYNHMSTMRSLFKELDESKKSEVRLGDNKKIQVEGKGTVAIKTSHGNVKLLDDVMLVPSLTHNLLSIGQLMVSGYSVLFDDGFCTIRDKKSGQTIVNVQMANNKMVPLEFQWLKNVLLLLR